ncbi:MAG: glutamine synthetase family protein [Oscillospiraceae bacterium]|nr:glutamine synthetase family protein [Oscillospiraceae bacterium]
MSCTRHEIMEFVKENEVKFIRLSFCDIFGQKKNIAIMARELEQVLENGMPFDGGAVAGFAGTARSDLVLMPDLNTMAALPWRPGPGRVLRFFCDIKTPEGTSFPLDSRCVLKNAVEKAAERGYGCTVGAECEFTLFKTDESGDPTAIPIDRGGYLDIAPLDRGEDIRREICLTLEEMGIYPETSHHERGHGQNEIDFRPGDALSCADNFLTFKNVVRAIASRNGLHASFMPKPIAEAPGNGLHVNLSLSQDGVNIFKNTNEGHSAAAESFIAGILAMAPEITLFLNPLANSYERLGRLEAPGYVSWSHQNRSQLIRIPAASGEKVRLELRSPDPAVNPYTAFALIIAAGFHGIDGGLRLPRPVNADLYKDRETAQRLIPLPPSLNEAIEIAKGSSFARAVIGQELFSKYICLKEKEAAETALPPDGSEAYRKKYFGII